MAKTYATDERLRFFIEMSGIEALVSCSMVRLLLSAAATKIVPTAEYNPFECIKANIYGAMNVIDAAI